MWASLVPLSQLTILRGPINCAECENCMSRLMCGAAYIYRWLCESAKGNQNRPHIIVDRQRRQRRSTCQRDWRIAKKPVKCDTWIVWFSYRRSNWLQLNESLSNRIRRIADIYIYLYLMDVCSMLDCLFVYRRWRQWLPRIWWCQQSVPRHTDYTMLSTIFVTCESFLLNHGLDVLPLEHNDIGPVLTWRCKRWPFQFTEDIVIRLPTLSVHSHTVDTVTQLHSHIQADRATHHTNTRQTHKQSHKTIHSWTNGACTNMMMGSVQAKCQPLQFVLSLSRNQQAVKNMKLSNRAKRCGAFSKK